jgi:hypothetical protein
MSLFHSINVDCPFCKDTVTVMAAGSVNADRRPDFREAILEDRFQDTTCGTCNKSFRLQPEFNYLDAGRGQWIAAMPAARMPGYLQAEDDVAELFDRSYGKGAPKAAQGVGSALKMRLTFGWPAIREKLLAREHDLDDTVLEMLKLDLLRELASAPLSPGIELRLVGLTGHVMGFAWIETQSEKAIEQFTLARSWYDGITTSAEAWSATRDRLTNGAFVDMQKLYMGQGRAAATL